MINQILFFIKKIGNYKLKNITSKIEYRRAQIFNFSIFLECFILFINSIRHFFNNDINSTVTLLITLFFLLFLYFI